MNTEMNYSREQLKDAEETMQRLDSLPEDQRKSVILQMNAFISGILAGGYS